MPLKRSKVEAALKKKGFKEYPDADHKYFYFEYKDKITSIFTKTSHGTKYKTIGDPLVSLMAKQLRISNSDFKEFVKCTLSSQDYKKKLIDTKYI